MRAGNGMAYHRQGVGPWVVLLHGIPGQGRAWERVEHELADSFQVLTLDLFGFGESECPSTPTVDNLGLQAQVSGVTGLLDELGVSSAIVVGHDFGAPIAALLAAARPDLVGGLALLAGNTFPDTPIPFPLSLTNAPIIGRTVTRLLFSRASLALMLRNGTGPTAPSPDASVYLGSSSQRQAIAVIFAGALRGLADLYAPVAQALDDLTMPVLVGWGDRDPFFPVEQGTRTAKATRGRLRIFEDAGHFLPHECPVDVAHEIAALAAAVDR